MVKRVFELMVLMALFVVGLALPAAAAPAATTFVTMVGNGDYIAGNSAWLWRPGSGTVSASGSGTAGALYVSVSGGDSGQSFDLSFAAPPGEQLVAGEYVGAQRTPFRTAGHPGLDMSGESRGCNQVSGHFTVLDIAADGSSFWIVYEAHCEGRAAATFGEVRYNEPGADSDLLVAPDRIAWPDQAAGTSARLIPVTLVNTSASPVTISSAITSGTGFGVASNSCTTLAVGASCVVQASFKPTAFGDYAGTLTITDSTAAGAHTISLQGTGVAVPVRAAVGADRGIYLYGQSAKVTATLTGTYLTHTQVSIYRQLLGGAKTLVSTRNVDSTGHTSVWVRVTEKTTFIVEWTDGAASSSARTAVLVRARVTETMLRYRSRSGSYFLYKAGSRIYTRGVVTPNRAGHCLHFYAQVRIGGMWLDFASTRCVGLTSTSTGYAYLAYDRRLLGRPLRFQAWYVGDAASLSRASAWHYARWVR